MVRYTLAVVLAAALALAVTFLLLRPSPESLVRTWCHDAAGCFAAGDAPGLVGLVDAAYDFRGHWPSSDLSETVPALGQPDSWKSQATRLIQWFFLHFCAAPRVLTCTPAGEVTILDDGRLETSVSMAINGNGQARIDLGPLRLRFQRQGWWHPTLLLVSHDPIDPNHLHI